MYSRVTRFGDLFRKKDLQYRDKRHDNQVAWSINGDSMYDRGSKRAGSPITPVWKVLVLYDYVCDEQEAGERGYVHVNAPFNLVRGRHIGHFQLGAVQTRVHHFQR